jgi:hypothetical protein
MTTLQIFELKLDRELIPYNMITSFRDLKDGGVYITVKRREVFGNTFFELKYTQDELESSLEEIRLQVLTYAALVG